MHVCCGRSPARLKCSVPVAAVFRMKVRTFLASSRQLVAALVVFTVVSTRSTAAAPEPGSSDAQLARLIDSANYSQADKEALKSGLSVALPGAATEYVSQKTIEIQVNNSTADFGTAVSLATKLADHFEARTREFANSDGFRRVEPAQRQTVATYLNDVVQQYRARTYETLLSHYNLPLSVPANVPHSADNADYRALLDVAVKAAVLSNPTAVAAPAVAVKPAETAATAVASAETPAAEKSAPVESPAEVQKPVLAEKTTEAEKPVVVETVAEAKAVQSVVAEKAAEKSVAAEKSSTAQKPPVPGTRYALVVGDSLALLGRLNKIPPAAIVDANPGLDPMRMRVGQVIVIPTLEWVNAQKVAAQSKDAPLLSAK